MAWKVKTLQVELERVECESVNMGESVQDEKRQQENDWWKGRRREEEEEEEERAQVTDRESTTEIQTLPWGFLG